VFKIEESFLQRGTDKRSPTGSVSSQDGMGFQPNAPNHPHNSCVSSEPVWRRVSQTMTKRVLFLCTGNYYRSRYAEELFNHLAKAEGLSWRAFSRGVAERQPPANMGPISRFTLKALRAKSIDPEGAERMPSPCTLADFEQAGLVIALKEAEHRPMIELRFPEVADRVTYWHVDDIELVDPSTALALIENHVRELISTLK
jgi:low molecular weight protein-tyrosine phosphatase